MQRFNLEEKPVAKSQDQTFLQKVQQKVQDFFNPKLTPEQQQKKDAEQRAKEAEKQRMADLQAKAKAGGSVEKVQAEIRAQDDKLARLKAADWSNAKPGLREDSIKSTEQALVDAKQRLIGAQEGAAAKAELDRIKQAELQRALEKSGLIIPAKPREPESVLQIGG